MPRHAATAAVGPQGDRPRSVRRRDPTREEAGLILDAALAVMRTNGFAGATLEEILTAAGLSTRAFYRHFDSKDAVLVALHRREADRVTARVRAVADSSSDPHAALVRCIDELLNTHLDPRRASRAAVLTSDGAARALGYAEELDRSFNAHAAVLADVLRAGNDAGMWSSADPMADACSIYDVVRGLLRRHHLEPGQVSAGAIRAQAKRFALGAITAPSSS